MRQSLSGVKKSPIWVRIKSKTAPHEFNAIAYNNPIDKGWYLIQYEWDGCRPQTINSGLGLKSYYVGIGSIKDIKREGILGITILPRKPKDEKFKKVTLKNAILNLIPVNKHYNALINPGFIQVGCQTIPNAVVRKICSKLID